MKTFFTPKIGLVVLVWLAGAVAALGWPARTTAEGDSTELILAPVGTAFTYQGHLESGGNPANGAYDFQFMLLDAPAGGNQIGATANINDLPVSGGFFSAQLDFGVGAFGGGKRWLQIAVRPGASIGAYTILSPRQELTPAPYAQALPNLYTNESSNFVGVGRDFRISGNEVFGVRFTGNPNQYGGMYVETSDAQGWPFYGYATNGTFRAWTYYNGTTRDWSLYSSGIRLKVPASGGLRIGPSLDYSLVISNTTGTDGIRILDTTDDGIQIGNNPDFPDYGVYIPSPGVPYIGLLPNTSNSAHQWALYTVDNIFAGNVTASAYSLVVQVIGSDALSPGDLVAVTGVTEPIPGSADPIPLVRLADAGTYNGVIGVVKSRMVYDIAPGKEAEGEMLMQSAEGAANPGDYVSLVVYGVADLKIQTGIQIDAGERLTASSAAGLARPLQKQVINGMTIVEGAPVIGIALAGSVNGQDTIPVFVTLR